MSGTYLSIMLQSLQRKDEVLDEIIRLNDLQKEQLTSPDSSVEEFDRTVEDKSACIKRLELLDDGFQKLYGQVEDELRGRQELYADTIQIMKGYIRSVTDKSVKIQAQEARNKDLMTQKFAAVNAQAQEVRRNSRAITEYYRSMKQSDYMDPQFMDNKK